MEKRLDSPADNLDKRALIQGPGEIVTSGQDSVHPASVKTKIHPRKADSDADVRLHLVEAELESMRAKLNTANAEIAAMQFVHPFRISDLTRSAELLDLDTVFVDNALQIMLCGRAPLKEQYSKSATITASFLSTFVQIVEPMYSQDKVWRFECTRAILVELHQRKKKKTSEP
ncbi:hypothetical protein B0H13DRAFT_1892036 [Mycena leptocephala]|nr:hypothetical protein B0H13DRAFT_1892036 [Mycena leptocephala]